MFFGSSVSEPLKPLQDEIADSKLGQFAVGRQLNIYQPILPPTTPPSTGADILFLKKDLLTRMYVEISLQIVVSVGTR